MYNQYNVVPLDQRGASSLEGTRHLCAQLPALFQRHNIRSIFDAGANDAAWQAQTLAHMTEYHAGERNESMVEIAKSSFPGLDICVHDVTQDPLPSVDLLFARDVAIHMNNFYKNLMLKNWLSSGILWLLITQISHCNTNLDFEIVPGEWKFADVNWHLDPWRFPEPVDQAEDVSGQEIRDPTKPPGRYMCLWHRDQIRGLI